MTENDNTRGPSQRVLEVHGRFGNEESLQAAIDGLRHAGYLHADARLPEDDKDPQPGADDSEPTDQDHQQMRVLTTSIAGSVGTLIGAVALLASGAAVPLAAGVALAAGLGSGALTEGIGHRLERKQIDEYDRRGAAGTLLLAMRVWDQGQADEVTRIMHESGANWAEQIRRPEETLVSGISAAAWTG